VAVPAWRAALGMPYFNCRQAHCRERHESFFSGCDVGYDTVSTWNKSCQDVAKQDFRYAQPLNVTGCNISVLPYSPTHHVYLIRMPGGCVSINKEMLYP
jgi:hypothetical protein